MKDDLNMLRNEAYDNAIRHGWHDEEHSDQHWMMLIMCELAEAVEADRKNRHADVKAFEYDTMLQLREMKLSDEDYAAFERNAFNSYIKDTVEDELADVVIRCLDFAGLECIPLPYPLYDTAGLSDMTFTEFTFDIIDSMISDFQTEGVGEVIRDTIESVMSYAHFKHIDIEWHIRHKMSYNRKRPYKHGKEY